MFSGGPPDEAVGELDKAPSYWNVQRASFLKPLDEVALASTYIPSPESNIETRKRLNENIGALNQTINDPQNSTLTNLSSYVASFAGGAVSLVPTIPLIAATAPVIEAGAFAVAPTLMTAGLSSGEYLSTRFLLSRPISQFFGQVGEKYLPGYTVEEGAAKAFRAAAQFKAATFPSYLAETYNQDLNQFNLREAMSADMNDQFSLLMGAGAFGAGKVLYQAWKSVASKSIPIPGMKGFKSFLRKNKDEKISVLDEALKDGSINKEAYDFAKKSINEPQNPELQKEALKHINDINVDADPFTNNVLLKVLTKDDQREYKQAIDAYLGANLSEEKRDLLLQYVSRDKIDRLNLTEFSDPRKVAGYHGVVSYIEDLKKNEPERFKRLDQKLENILDNVKEKDILSQDDLYNQLKSQGKFNNVNVPYMVPKEVSKKLALAKKLNDLESKKTNIYKGLKGEEALNEIKKDIENVKLKNSKQELNDIKNKLLQDVRKGKDIRIQPEYHRLKDKSEFLPEAQAIISRLNEEKTSLNTDALKTMLENLLEFSDSTFGTVAKHENVMSYLKAYADRVDFKNRSTEPVKSVTEDGKRDITRLESLLKKQDIDRDITNLPQDLIQEVKAKEIDTVFDDYEEVKKKLDNYESNNKVVDALINCVEGKING